MLSLGERARPIEELVGWGLCAYARGAHIYVALRSMLVSVQRVRLKFCRARIVLLQSKPCQGWLVPNLEVRPLAPSVIIM